MDKLKRGNAIRRHTITGLHTRPPIRLIRRFSSVEEHYETERRKTISCYQRLNLEIGNFSKANLFEDEVDCKTKLQASLEGYNLPDLYVNILCTMFPQIQSGNKPNMSNELLVHLKSVFPLSDEEQRRLLDNIKLNELPQRMVNLEIVEAKNIPPTDPNGSSDPFCIVYVNDRDFPETTRIIRDNLNPFWRKYFTLQVNDVTSDVLNVEVMNYNEKTERLRDRVKGFKDLKSPGFLGILLCEIANARSEHELIGTVKIPVSDLTTKPVENWFGIEHGDLCKGKIFLRVALGHSKSRSMVFNEFLQMLHLLLIYELDHGSSQEIPFYWDEHFEINSKRVLRQLKWQGGLKSKDVVLAKWIVYTKVNSIIPLNANMMFLLMDDVMERVAKREYDTKQIPLLRDSIVLLVESIIKFFTNIHDVLSSDALLEHIKHMIRTLSLLIELLDGCPNFKGVMTPFRKSDLIERVKESLKIGANKFYEKVFTNCSSQQTNNGEDPLYLTLNILLKTGHILNEDIRLALKSIQAEFKTVLDIDFVSITYQIYDEKFGKMVKGIMEQYIVSFVFADEKPSTENYEELDEESPSVKIAETVIQLYFVAKRFSGFLLSGHLDQATSSSEYSLARYYNDWFFYGVAVWIDILRRKITKWVKNSITYSGLYENDDVNDVFHINNNEPERNSVPCSTSARDTAEMFHAIYQFWQSLGWQNPYQAFKIVRKLLEELYEHLIYYAAQLHEVVKTCKPPIHKQYDEAEIFAYLNKSCMEIRNIHYVKNQVKCLKEELEIDKIIQKIEFSSDHSLKEKTEDFQQSITTITVDMQNQVMGIVENILKHCRRSILPKVGYLFNELCKDDKRNSTNPVNRGQEFKKLITFIDACITIMNKNLETEVFSQALEKLWEEILNNVNNFVDNGLEMGKKSDFFLRVKNALTNLHAWLDETYFSNKNFNSDNTKTVEMYEKLNERLCNFQVALTTLKIGYYERRYKSQQLLLPATNDHGSITVRTCYLTSSNELMVELLNARNLKSYDSNNLSDPYAVVSLVPNENFTVQPTFVTRVQYKTLFPLFEETFKFKMSKEERRLGFLLIRLYDRDYFGSEYMGEVLYPLVTVIDVKNEDDLLQLPQNFIPICKPEECDKEYLKQFEQRLWDKESVKFARQEMRKMQ